MEELLKKYDREPAQKSIEALLADIVAHVNALTPAVLHNFGLGTGRGGAILLNCHYARLTGNDEFYEVAEKLLLESIDALNPVKYKAILSNYYGDLSEFGTLISYLEENGHLNQDTGFSFYEFDNLLIDRVQTNIEQKNFGIGTGALSISSYLLRRLDNSPEVYRCTLDLFEAIYKAAEGDKENGYYWTTNYFEEPRVYTGLAHGNAMIINFLCSIHAKGIEKERCEELMRYAIKFLLLNQIDPVQYGSNFPLWVGRNEETKNHCVVYGDIGTVYAIIKAAQILKDSAYLAEAIILAYDTVTRHRKEDTTLLDASIKYGVSSPYLVYNRIYQLTGIEAFKTAANYWFDQISEMNTADNEYLGFNSHFFKKYPEGQLGFGYGLAGIGLVFMQHLSEGALSINEFTWIP
ncbi:lantibiotic modifying enzyme [Pedobacter cryoconitis]|uniref:Lantibiotic modifying enzyme n=1 Tax=Pedobacter cryoconitis TaxID=188932 RepID=A0A7W9DXK7_9SPHI|nr:lanthionine synthetase LanC family protein [Pedobacter cryoconitis]MBB5635227.1 lantibiotic modifying enzyme [Pedobacter cryoconitis]